MEYLGIKVEELARRMSLEVETLRLLIEGKCNVLTEIAKKQEPAIGSAMVEDSGCLYYKLT
jgi:plasmid maintenance system antidote protein VapI